MNFFAFFAVNVGYAGFIHQSVTFLVYVYVIVTRELAMAGKEVIALLVSGFLFPFVSFLVRRFVISEIYKVEVAPFRSDEVTYKDFAKNYNRVLAVFCVALLFTPVLTLYLNSTLTTAIAAGLVQMATETGVKLRGRGRLERSDSIVLPTHITNNLPFVASLIALRFTLLK
jgi:hypothetical protein